MISTCHDVFAFDLWKKYIKMAKKSIPGDKTHYRYGGDSSTGTIGLKMLVQFSSLGSILYEKQFFI